MTTNSIHVCADNESIVCFYTGLVGANDVWERIIYKFLTSQFGKPPIGY